MYSETVEPPPGEIILTVVRGEGGHKAGVGETRNKTKWCKHSVPGKIRPGDTSPGF